MHIYDRLCFSLARGDQEDHIRILLVEDDEALAERLLRALTQAGYALDHASNGHDAVHLASAERFDAIVLDIGLPDISGLDVLDQLRRAKIPTPVLILTAHGTWSEKVEGLNRGADDYMTKPFHTPELTARLNALLRRSAGIAHNVITHGDLELDLGAGRAQLAGEAIELTALELRMLKYFMTRSQHVISQSELTEHLYPLDETRESNTVEVYVSRLRRKIGSDRIKTIRGLGYRFG